MKNAAENDREVTIAEIKREFQLERMVLFSDAVFAIVITLMAIELRLPHETKKLPHDVFVSNLLHLGPILLAYIVSFFFIGSMWYRHLRIFAHLKSYDTGLVVRNLLMLCFIGLFPFSVSLMAKPHGTIPYVIYFTVVLLCNWSQVALFHYIMVTRPNLRAPGSISEDLDRLRKNKIITSCLTAGAVLAVITSSLIKDPELKSLGVLWLTPVMLLSKFLLKKKTTT